MLLYYKFRAFLVTWLLRLLPRSAPVVFKGANSALALCEQVATLGFTKVIVVTDSFLGGSGILDGTKTALSEHGVEYVVYDGVLPDPTFDKVQEAQQLLAAENCQAIIAMRQKMEMALKPEGLKNEDIPAMAKEAIAEAGSLYPVPRYLSKAEVANIIAGIAAG